MKNGFFMGTAFTGALLLMINGCSKVPQTEIDTANTAIENARSAGAEVYVDLEFLALQDSMKSVMAGIETQKSKLFKDFNKSRENLAGVTRFAGEVQQQSENRKKKLAVEIGNTLAEVRSLIETNRKLILEAPKGKEGTTVLVAIRAEIDGVENSMNSAQTMFESGDYLASLDRIKAAKEKASSINAELTAVIAKYQANVKYRKS